MDKRYPIGTFECEGEISTAQRNEWIEEIAELPTKLKEAIKGLEEKHLDLPYREGGWTLRQVVHHLADSHMNSLIRFKLALTEDTPTIKPYLEDQWAQLQDSSKADVSISLHLLEALHERWVYLLRSLQETDYNRTFYHPESQKKMKLDYTLGMYAWHGKHHVAHIEMLRKNEGI